MAVRVVVEDTFQITGRGPVIVGLVIDGVVTTGDTLTVEDTGVTVVVRGLESCMPRQPAEWQRVGLLVRQEDAQAATPGSALVSPPGA